MVFGSAESSARLADEERRADNAPIMAPYRMSLAGVLVQDGIICYPLANSFSPSRISSFSASEPDEAFVTRLKASLAS